MKKPGTHGYRIMEYADGSGFGIHFFSFSAEGKPVGVATQPVTLIADSVDVLGEELARINKALSHPPIKEPVGFLDTMQRCYVKWPGADW